MASYCGDSGTTETPVRRRRNKKRVHENGAAPIIALVEHQDQGPVTTRFLYDNLGRLVRVCDALASTCTQQLPKSDSP